MLCEDVIEYNSANYKLQDYKNHQHDPIKIILGSACVLKQSLFGFCDT